MTLEEFGPFLVEQRKKKNLTQTELAEQLNVSTAAVSKWERCLCLPEITKFNDIAEVFELSLMEVMQCKVNESATPEIDAVISDSITLAKTQYRTKAKKRIFIVVAVLLIGILVHYFPIYHVAQVWSPSFYSTGEISKLLHIGNNNDLNTARLFIAKANEAFSDITTPYDQLEDKYGPLMIYATNKEMGGATEKHSLKLWSAHFDSDDGYGYVWVHHSSTVYDSKGNELRGSWNIPALWKFEKDDSEGWKLIQIKEHP